MKDLYNRLGISQTDSFDSIHAAVILCQDESVRRDATRILLNAASREVYDRNLILLRQIAFLRSELNLLQSPNWGRSMQEEFTVPTRVYETSTKGTVKAKRIFPGCCGATAGTLFIVFLFTVFLIGIFSSDNSQIDQPERISVSGPRSPTPTYQYQAEKTDTFVPKGVKSDQNSLTSPLTKNSNLIFPMRVWTDHLGRKLSAELVSVHRKEDGYFYGDFRRPTGELFTYAIEKLSQHDVELVRESMSRLGIY